MLRCCLTAARATGENRVFADTRLSVETRDDLLVTAGLVRTSLLTRNPYLCLELYHSAPGVVAGPMYFWWQTVYEAALRCSQVAVCRYLNAAARWIKS